MKNCISRHDCLEETNTSMLPLTPWVSCKNLELIVVDDCSKTSVGISSNYTGKDSRIHVLQVEKNGEHT